MTGHSSFQNGKLMAERDGVKRRTEELVMEKDALKVPPLPSALTTPPTPQSILLFPVSATKAW